MTEDASTLPRETGAVKTTPCPNCGTELTWVPTAIGGHRAESCPTCWPPAVVSEQATPDAPPAAPVSAPTDTGTQQAAADPVTPPVTTGTDVTDVDPPAGA